MWNRGGPPASALLLCGLLMVDAWQGASWRELKKVPRSSSYFYCRSPPTAGTPRARARCSTPYIAHSSHVQAPVLGVFLFGRGARVSGRRTKRAQVNIAAALHESENFQRPTYCCVLFELISYDLFSINDQRQPARPYSCTLVFCCSWPGHPVRTPGDGKARSSVTIRKSLGWHGRLRRGYPRYV